MTTNTYVIWGGKGHARVVHEALFGSGRQLLAVIDRDPVPPPIAGVPLVVGGTAFQAWLADRASEPPPGFVVAIGGGHGEDRLAIADRLTAWGLEPITVRHPTAIVARCATLGSGSQVLAGSCVAAAARLGSQVIVNTRPAPASSGSLALKAVLVMVATEPLPSIRPALVATVGASLTGVMFTAMVPRVTVLPPPTPVLPPSLAVSVNVAAFSPWALSAPVYWMLPT